MLRVAVLHADKSEPDRLVSEEVFFGHSNGLIQTKQGFISNLVKKLSAELDVLQTWRREDGVWRLYARQAFKT